MGIRLFELVGEDPTRRFSPYCWRTCLALAHKGLAWETIPWRFTEKARLAAHGARTVPLLLDGERAILDSWDIAGHLDATYPDRPPLFDSAAARSEGLFIKLWTERTLHPLLTRMLVRDIVDVLGPDDAAYFRASREQRLGRPLEAVVADRSETLLRFREALDPLRAMLAVQPWLGGSRANYADYTVFGAFLWARGVSPWPLLAADDPVYAWRSGLLDAFDGLAARATGFPV